MPNAKNRTERIAVRLLLANQVADLEELEEAVPSSAKFAVEESIVGYWNTVT